MCHYNGGLSVERDNAAENNPQQYFHNEPSKKPSFHIYTYIKQMTRTEN